MGFKMPENPQLPYSTGFVETIQGYSNTESLEDQVIKLSEDVEDLKSNLFKHKNNNAKLN